MWLKHAHAQSQFGVRNEKLKAKRASETESQRKEMLRIRRENKKTDRSRTSAWPLSKD